MTAACSHAAPVVSGTTPLPANVVEREPLVDTRRATLAGNFQTFLTLLTTQLQNQNPLDPLDTNQFTQQLVQFAGVEQQLKTNDQLTSLVIAAADRAIDPGAGLRRQDRGGRRQHHGIRRTAGDLESQRPTRRQRRPSPSPTATGQTVFSGNYSAERRAQPALHLGRQGQ